MKLVLKVDTDIYRVSRGTSRYISRTYARTVYRDRRAPSVHGNLLGFRLYPEVR